MIFLKKWKNEKKCNFLENEKHPICECEKKTCSKTHFRKGGVAITPDLEFKDPKKGGIGSEIGGMLTKR
jgi:hypothetical protein